MLRSIYFWMVLIFSTVMAFAVAVLVLPFNRGGKAIHLIGRIWGRLNLATSGVKLETRGLENIIKERPQVLMSNHQSIYDIFALSTLPLPVRWIAKKELFRIPALGWLMLMAGCVSIDRSSLRKALIGMDSAQAKINNGASILIFPEGTRSYDGVLQPFKKGGFVLALKTKAPIVPITIIGSAKIMQRGTKKVHPGNIEMIIDEPIEPLNSEVKDKEGLIRRVREVISKNLSNAQLYSSTTSDA
ncbi:MAG: lysophospholipid acyltransferase family protein [Pseudomonadota bacterium]